MPTVRKPTAGQEPFKDVLRPEVRAVMPDLKYPEEQARLKAAIEKLDTEEEAEVMRWIESVSLFDNEDRDLE